MFKGMTLFSWMNISDALLCSGWAGLDREEQPGSNGVLHVILSWKFYVYLLRLGNAWLNSMGFAPESKNILCLVSGWKVAAWFPYPTYWLSSPLPNRCYGAVNGNSFTVEASGGQGTTPSAKNGINKI